MPELNPVLKEIRCKGKRCNKLLFKANITKAVIEIKCGCGHMNIVKGGQSAQPELVVNHSHSGGKTNRGVDVTGNTMAS